jgi:hypothetical protein
MKRRLAVSAAAVGMAAFLSGAAQASVIPVLASVTPFGSNFLFSYSGQLAPDQGVKAGNQLVIVDFAGYVAGSVHSAIPTVSASVSNSLPAGLLLDPGFTDDNTIPDLVFTYNGPNFDTSGGPYPAQIDFTGLSAVSIYGNHKIGSFSAVAVKNNGLETGTPTYNVGEVSVPAPTPVPEPFTMSIFGAGLAGAAALRRRKKAKTA